MKDIAAAIDNLAESIENKDRDAYDGNNSATHLYNIASSLEELSNTLKKIEAKMN